MRVLVALLCTIFLLCLVWGAGEYMVLCHFIAAHFEHDPVVAIIKTYVIALVPMLFLLICASIYRDAKRRGERTESENGAK